jgi:hypothetical protein
MILRLEGQNPVALLGKFLQFAGLIVTGAALFIGIQSDNPRMELGYLSGGAIVFLVGMLVLKFSGRSA